MEKKSYSRPAISVIEVDEELMIQGSADMGNNKIADTEIDPNEN